MSKNKQNNISLNREGAFEARPLAAKIQKRVELPDGGARVTIGCRSTRAQKFLLRLPDIIKREFILDAYGLEILALCDGQKNVRHIVKRFAKAHDLNHQESENAITVFLKNMMKKGLVVMIIPK